jgi:hypothetical protein
LFCSPGWPQTHNLHASAFWVLGLQVWTTIPGYFSLLKSFEDNALFLEVKSTLKGWLFSLNNGVKIIVCNWLFS